MSENFFVATIIIFLHVYLAASVASVKWWAYAREKLNAYCNQDDANDDYLNLRS